MSAAPLAINDRQRHGATAVSSTPAAAASPLESANRRIPWRWIAWDIAVWSAVALMFAVQTTVRVSTPFSQIMVNELASFFPCALLTPVVAFIAIRFRYVEGRRLAAWLAHVIGVLIFTLVGGAMMGILEWSLPWVPAGDGMVAAARNAVLRYSAIDVLIYVAIAGVITAIVNGHEARARAVRSARLQAQLAEAQLHALSAQLHPHFLFNTLHAISALVRPDPKRAEQLIARLSDLLRQMLDSSDRVEIPLEEELSFLQKYVDIQEARSGRLHVTFDVAPSALSVQVPRLVLQPLVENAIRHGIARRAGAGEVGVVARRDSNHLTLVVRDDGAGVPTTGPAREGVGLSSTRARLAQLYGADHSFSIVRGAECGTVCTIRLPCREVEEPSARWA